MIVAELLLAIAAVAPVQGQGLDDVKIEVQPVAGSVHVLFGRGGNIGLLTGEDGAFLIDDQFAPLTERILAGVAEVTDEPVRFLVNTHWHGDHTGGNENLGDRGVTIVAHDNVRRRLSNDPEIGGKTEDAPSAALPVITFAESVRFYWNGEEIDVFHVPHAHTDGDAIIHFTKADVFHMGDTFFNGLYPFIDPDSGGVIDGAIDAQALVIDRASPRTRIIPGHGPLATVADLKRTREMLVTVRDRIRTMIDEGKTKDEVVASKPTREFDGAYGGGFLPPDRFVGLVFDGMVKNG